MSECKIEGKEKGVRIEIECVADIIKSKESKGLDASFERELLRSWSKYKGYESAKQTLDDCGKPVQQV